MNKLIDYGNFLNWCKMWNKKPSQYKTLNEFIYETKQYNQPYNYEKKFIINDLGHFSLFDVLVGFEYPTLFVCKDVFSAYYLFYESDYDTDMNEWLIIKITNKQYWNLKTSKISLQQTFKNSLEKKWYVFREIGDKQHLQYLTNYPIEYFPFKKDIFVGIEDFITQQEKQEKLLDLYKQLVNENLQINLSVLEKIKELENENE